MPAEWEPHEATWIAWPHQRFDWPGKFATIPWAYVEIVRHLHAAERVKILVNDAGTERKVRKMLQKAAVDLKQVEFFQFPTNRVWTRDFGPIFLRGQGGSIAMTDWKFNAWSKYPDWQLDNKIPARIQKKLKIPCWEPRSGQTRIVLEGGSIDVNGAGLLLTTEEGLLDTIQARNPELNRADLELAFRDYLGIDKVLWLGRGIAGDDTHGHIDDIARFAGPHTIVAAVELNPSDDNYKALQDNLQRLKAMTDLEGKHFDIIELPLPAPLWFDGRRLPVSYVNFYIANDRLLVPTFNDPADRIALGILADVFPDRKVIGIHSVDLAWGLGTLHCLTQQQPR